MKVKSPLLLLAVVLSIAFANAQAPQLMNYQAVVRDAQGTPLAAGTHVTIKFQIHDGSPSGSVVFNETTSAITNQFGLITLGIGAVGNLSAVNWGTGVKYLQVLVDPNGGSNFTDMGTTQLLSVPYALFAGSSVNTGVTGPQGATGATGNAGAQGATGAAGATGLQGSQGQPGVNGATGSQGIAGVTGAAGVTGQQGAQGVSGADGAAGLTGATGPQGLQGPSGIDGTNGATGATGTQGPSGVDGATGATGTNGATGLQGAQGPSGVNGTDGVTGPTGANGATGSQGPSGAGGATGATGPAGSPAVYGDFYALMPGDNAATVAPGTAVQFPQNGTASGTITRITSSSFNIAEIGDYMVYFQVSISEPGQLQLLLNGVPISNTVVGRATGTSQISGTFIISTTVPNSVISVINPFGSSIALSITPDAGGVNSVSAHLIISKITNAGPVGADGATGITGPTGAMGATGVGINGSTGATGASGQNGTNGNTGATGATGVGAAAEFTRTIQFPNNSVPPGTAFTIDQEVFNTAGSGITATAGNGGTVFALTNTGTYIFDYEMSLASASSVALYTGPTVGTMIMDNNSVAGSLTGTTWIHGRALVDVTTIPTFVEISPVVGTATVVTAGTDAGSYMTRLTITTSGGNGATGATGATGAQGAIGLQGATGVTGTNGTNGATGATGVTGSTGATGLSGTVIIPFSTGTVLNGASVVSAAPVIMGFGNSTVETINFSGQSTSPPQAGGFSFTVPAAGTIQNLQISCDLFVASATSINVIGLQYDFTVLQSSSSPNNGIAHNSNAYVTTGLTSSVNFGAPFSTVIPGSYYSASNLNTGSIVVQAGDRIGIRIRTLNNTDAAAADITQLSFNASLTFTPN